ncbi:hypothetical protein [Cyclobacterium qasimii]|uniref:hypothetical protein n=1 Tax=Cyclobacterium qasimii TaxID=1350429 RepID=UPI001F1D5E21|nr:hypothetical protein [Cyclobacterium qasimii]
MHSKQKENNRAIISKNLIQKILKTLEQGEAFSLEELFCEIDETLDDFSVGLIREMEDEGLISSEKNGVIKKK